MTYELPLRCVNNCSLCGALLRYNSACAARRLTAAACRRVICCRACAFVQCSIIAGCQRLIAIQLLQVVLR
jgi:hypothetical protein